MRRTSDQVDRDHEQHAGSGPHDGPRCTCRHDGMRWAEMCAAAREAHRVTHEDAARVHRLTWGAPA